MLTKLYLDTTNPKSTFTELFSNNMYPLLVSIIFHTILYVLFVNMTYFIFFGRLLSMKINNRLIIALLIIMALGYVGRFYHVKEIYGAYNNDITKTRNHLDKLYISWIFLA